MKVTVPHYLYKNSYYWYFLRMIEKTFSLGQIGLAKTDEQPLYTPFVSVVFFDDKPVILDVRDDHALPLPELKKYPGALVFKANYSSELWDNPPATFEYPITEEERKYRSQVRPFIYGRALSIPLNANERTHFTHCVKPINKKIVSYTGAGVHRQQTESRLKVFDLINEIFGDKAKLIWYDRNDHYDNKWNEYWQKRQKYLNDAVSWDYENFIRFLSQGQYSLNFPGIAVSQPFRFIDGIIAQRAVISTKIWIDAWKMFPCLLLSDICGYFGTGDWNIAKLNLEQLKNMPTESDPLLIEAMNRWYDNYLSAEGMLNNQFIKGLNR